MLPVLGHPREAYRQPSGEFKSGEWRTETEMRARAERQIVQPGPAAMDRNTPDP
jgi:hypothetical protein